LTAGKTAFYNLLKEKKMKQAIKVLEKRIKVLDFEYNKKDVEFENCEMISDCAFLICDLENIKLEIVEIQGAIEVLNSLVK
jgi:hypothetical protein